MAFDFSVTIDDSKLRQKLSELQSLLPAEMNSLMSELEGEAFTIYQGQVPVAKSTPSRPIVGTLRNSVFTRKTANGFVVGASAPHGRYPAYGVKPHTISARTPRGMRFWWDKAGGWVRGVFVVSHPGQVRNPFHARAYRLIYLKAVQLVERAKSRIQSV